MRIPCSNLSLCVAALWSASTAGLAACSEGESATAPKTDAEYESAIVTGMHDSLLTDIDDLCKASQALADAAPEPSGRGWDADEDADALEAMKVAWIDARTAYEHIEGALAPLFPDIDFSIDARYDDFLTKLGGKGDDNPFDGKGVTGLHAAERILWADAIPARVVEFETALPGYRAASFPPSEQAAADFKHGLSAKIVDDAMLLRAQWKPQKIDLAGAFVGLISLMNEQQEKVNKAASNEEESRYSQRTMADIRDNLAGTIPIYALFAPWLATKTDAGDASKDGERTDRSIRQGFDGLSKLYATVKSDAIPEPPATWSAEDPSEADLQTDFGKLYHSVKAAVDPTEPGSIVDEMNKAAEILGFPELQEE